MMAPDWQQAYRHRDVNTVLPDVVTFTFENLRVQQPRHAEER